MATDVNSPRKWDENYERNTAGWDLGGPTPVFKRMLQRRQWLPGRMIVLGAGRGHDAREFARHSFQVTAVDFSSQAIQEMRRLARPDAPVEILQQDIFTLPDTFNESFDYVLEYTCFPRHLRPGQVCAIDPTRRIEYADLVTRLLKPEGVYIALAFPLDGRKGGPPFAVSVSEILDLFQARGFKLLSREKPLDSVKPRRHVEELFLFQKSAA
jgi:SAM-dependent methyltransferase